MDDPEQLARRFAALGHEARLRIVQLLLAHRDDGCVAGTIQQTLAIPASTLSHHLGALRQEGLISQRRQGRFLRYRAEVEALRALATAFELDRQAPEVPPPDARRRAARGPAPDAKPAATPAAVTDETSVSDASDAGESWDWSPWLAPSTSRRGRD